MKYYALKNQLPQILINLDIPTWDILKIMKEIEDPRNWILTQHEKNMEDPEYKFVENSYKKDLKDIVILKDKLIEYDGLFEAKNQMIPNTEIYYKIDYFKPVMEPDYV